MLKKDRIYTDQQKAFLEAMRDPSNLGDVRRCMTIAGYSPNSPTSFVTSSLKEELVELAREIMASGAVKATFGLFSVLDNPSMLGASSKLKAASQILDRANVVTQEQDVKVNVGGGIVIMPAKGSIKSLESTDDE